MIKFILMIFVLVFSIDASAYINLYPTSFNKRIDQKGAAEEFILYNPGASPVKYVIYAEETGNSDKESMVKWMEIYPKNVTLKAGEEKKVKLYIKSPSSAKKGEYSAVIGFKEVYVPGKNNKQSTLKILTDLKLHISGYVGDLKPVIAVAGLTKEGNSVSGTISNSGERRADIEIYLSGKNPHFLASTKIQKGESLKLQELNLNLPENMKNYKGITILEKESNIKLGEFNFN